MDTEHLQREIQANLDNLIIEAGSQPTDRIRAMLLRGMADVYCEEEERVCHLSQTCHHNDLAMKMNKAIDDIEAEVAAKLEKESCPGCKCKCHE